MTDETFIRRILADGTCVHGPAPRPRVIDAPRVHVVDYADEMYAESQTNDAIRDGDVIVCTCDDDIVAAVLVEAWPVCVHGDGDRYGLHTLNDDADITCLGQQSWGRMQDLTICPPNAERFVITDYSPPRGGGDYTASFELARHAVVNIAAND